VRSGKWADSLGSGEWGLGTGDWGLGSGTEEWGQRGLAGLGVMMSMRTFSTFFPPRFGLYLAALLIVHGTQVQFTNSRI
jgi:hypothetical protein